MTEQETYTEYGIENINRTHSSVLSSVERYLANEFKELEEDPEALSVKKTVFNELISNCLKDIHERLSLTKDQLTLALSIFTNNILKTLAEDLSVDQIHSNIKEDFFRHIADQIWVNKKRFNKEEVFSLYDVFYDNFMDLLDLYKHTLGKQHVLELNTLNYFDGCTAEVETLDEYQLIDPEEALPFDILDECPEPGETEESISKEKELLLTGEYDFLVVTKEQLKQQKRDRERMQKVDLIMEREKSVIEKDFEERVQQLDEEEAV